MMQQYYRIDPQELEDGKVADGVVVNGSGSWYGAVVVRIGNFDRVIPYSDEAGDYIPVPDDMDWMRELHARELD
jgi:hypothetical protein